MMNKKLNLAILCGGQSPEHAVSITSAKNVIAALDPHKYQLKVIFINPQGEWFLLRSPEDFLTATDIGHLLTTADSEKVTLVLGHGNNALMTLSAKPQWYTIDVVFPVLHGAHGEDGTVQGLLELANIPYVGPGVLGSAVAMDKAISKSLLRAAKIPVADFIVAHQHQIKKLNVEKILKKLGLPFFVKPANAGSSIGISKVKTPDELQKAIHLALEYDYKIIFERFIAGREIECAVLGNEKPQASIPGEIIPHQEFYTYEAKYFDPNGADLIIPAQLTQPTIAKIQKTAKKAFVVLGCEGMARVDFFVTKENRIYLNEANTIPGFTQISMYPKMWAASGMTYSKLIDRLIHLAIQRFARNRALENVNHTQTS